MYPLHGASTARGPRAFALVSAALFVAMFWGLYQTMTYTPHNQKPTLTDKLGLNSGPPDSSSSSTTTGPTISTTTILLHDAPATYPRLTRLSDSSILLAFTRVDDTTDPAGPPTRVLTVTRSLDDGRTFAPWGEVTRCVGDCGNLFLLEAPADPTDNNPTPSPRVLAAFRNHDYVDPVADRRLAYFRITVCASADGGRTWAYLAQAAEKPAPMGLWEPFVRVAADGALQMTFSQELRPADQDTILVTSRDGGRTWSPPRTVTGQGEALRDGMTGIAATTDRQQQDRPALVIVFETTRLGRFSVEAVVSYDDGATWGHRQVVWEAQPAGNAGAPQIESFDNGGLAAVFMTDVDTEDGRQWPDKASVKVVFGGPLADGKIQWGEPQVVCPRPSFWPGIFKLNGNQLMVACEHGGGIQGRILEWPAPQL